MAVSSLTVAAVQKPHLLHTFKPNISPCTFRSNSSSSSNLRAELSLDLKGSSKRRFFDLGLGLLAASLLILSPLDANATRIEYYATVSEPSCELNFVRSGLGYCDVAVGTGDEAPYGELINIHYTARFADGIVFDSSYKRARPLTMRIGVGKVLRGLDQGIGGGDSVPPMLVGGKRKLQIPPELAYGPEPAGCFSGDCNIPANATLVYDINFVAIYK
ncbi:photosynthetic NDH subunit of lumenal location 4, chloroplastic isoform X1 [Telopea speciosissima]|uniref:photosynthetic NDH subunit of lumenal location 4, chloroplastic isoform X1 n=1 Tax=Telopea speciosissima TaxID=54955 RepID=UPI001CC636A5|nr:photosynthetic NDH subunit of lumenal location 4, chloroplastic isoform X1 [Telopea speciosissima]XP_043722320.1 photosynthetic NDH subunit of lumenal location 4, chloroplastic isoform X1 [Telopea speciosissima]XP_043722321.1 photosynthetic NDH subunit of lumenal location 4, chloroplastic isoform X1 [Telopea speciosissima]XP_043722322.1 photosynthetic NDH subunit of lumenal location 4, chloroplastic isoform X1 [Telopea speciosissima]